MFTQEDLAQLQNKGISPQQIENQIAFFVKGFPFLNVLKIFYRIRSCLRLTI